MRKITIGEKTVNLVGAVATQWIYEDEFHGSSMQGDFERFITCEKGDSRHHDVLSKLGWAMARTACYPAPFPDYRTWLTDVQWDGSLGEVAKAVIFEATRALFPSKAALVSALEEQFDREHPVGEQTGPGVPGDGKAGRAELGGTGDDEPSGLR